VEFEPVHSRGRVGLKVLRTWQHVPLCSGPTVVLGVVVDAFYGTPCADCCNISVVVVVDFCRHSVLACLGLTGISGSRALNTGSIRIT